MNACACLLAGAGVMGGEAERDTHSDNFGGTPRQEALLDQAMSALVADLQAKGLPDQTLVVLGTGFGRTPRINDAERRDHHNKVRYFLSARSRHHLSSPCGLLPAALNSGPR